jgi:hypothetical protein
MLQLDIAIKSVNAMVFGETYQMRQLWAELCQCFLRNLSRELIETYFIDGILRLTTDSVCNVRVAVAKLLTGWDADQLPPWEDPVFELKPEAESIETMEESKEMKSDETEPKMKKSVSHWHWLLRRSDIQECVKRLANDDKDVYIHMIKLKPLFPELEFSVMSCRGMKYAPGGVASIQNCTRKSSTGNEYDVNESSDISIESDLLSPIMKTRSDSGVCIDDAKKISRHNSPGRLSS